MSSTDTHDSRLPECVAAWPECEDGAYDPRCCRFPKSCSCGVMADTPDTLAARLRARGDAMGSINAADLPHSAETQALFWEAAAALEASQKPGSDRVAEWYRDGLSKCVMTLPPEASLKPEPDEGEAGGVGLSADAVAEEGRCAERLRKTNADRSQWRERAISAEQALGLYGPDVARTVANELLSVLDGAGMDALVRSYRRRLDAGSRSPTPATEARPQAGAPTAEPGGLRALTEAATRYKPNVCYLEENRAGVPQSAERELARALTREAILALLDERDALRRELHRYDTALAVLEASVKTTDDDGAGFVTEYRWSTGAYHKILGFRGKILSQAAEFKQAVAERDALRAALREAREDLIREIAARPDDTESQNTYGDGYTSGLIGALQIVARFEDAALEGSGGQAQPASGRADGAIADYRDRICRDGWMQRVAMNGAHISEDGLYRYSLTRDLPPRLAPGAGYSQETCTFVMLNPSTADATVDDPTIRKCMKYARAWGYTRLKVVNLYAFRATDPRELLRVADPVGPENDHHLSLAFGGSDLTIAAWGANARPDRLAAFYETFAGWPLWCLGTTKHGQPRHPLYMLDAQLPVPFNDVAERVASATERGAQAARPEPARRRAAPSNTGETP